MNPDREVPGDAVEPDAQPDEIPRDAPEADVVEQHQQTTAVGDTELRDVPRDAAEADAIEQAQDAPFDDELQSE